MGGGEAQYYGGRANVSQTLCKSTAIWSEFEDNLADFRQSGAEVESYSGSFSTYDGCNRYDYDLSLSVGAAGYTMEIRKETRTSVFLFWKKEQTRYVANVTVTDTYDFDAWRTDNSFGSVMNNLGLALQYSNVVVPYKWEATFTISTKWE